MVRDQDRDSTGTRAGRGGECGEHEEPSVKGLDFRRPVLAICPEALPGAERGKGLFQRLRSSLT